MCRSKVDLDARLERDAAWDGCSGLLVSADLISLTTLEARS